MIQSKVGFDAIGVQQRCLCSHCPEQKAAVRGWSNIFGLRFAANANLSLLWLNSAVWASTASCIALVAFVFLLVGYQDRIEEWVDCCWQG